MNEIGRVYLCPTPIGNLKDITLRVLRVLGEVDTILAEDTRHSLPLLKHYEITTPMESYHKFNEREKTQEILRRLEEGESFAVISDAGMPGVSDPGGELITALQKYGLPYEVLPGPSAHVTAAVTANLPMGRYFFYGFLPSKHGERKRALRDLAEVPVPILFYEGPHRLEKTVADIHEVLGERVVVLVREMTKVYEECRSTTTTEFLEHTEDFQIKGEFVLILHPHREEKVLDIRLLLEEKLAEGLSPSKAVKVVSREYDLPKNQVYKESLRL
ncbi:MAG: 16S rRNA (cytidine(1402)-2'-O)-methyltransferase [Tissierellia bacterium]|nr:16S rRNA (cytidine(1402)-2'-O)-methyltransferase [Tissierellia bacterium]